MVRLMCPRLAAAGRRLPKPCAARAIRRAAAAERAFDMSLRSRGSLRPLCHRQQASLMRLRRDAVSRRRIDVDDGGSVQIQQLGHGYPPNGLFLA